MPRVSFMTRFVVKVGLERSWKKVCREPGNIFSKPMTCEITHEPSITQLISEYTYQHAIRRTVSNHIPSHKQASTPRRAIVIHIVNGNLRHAELVEDALAASGITIAIARHALLNIVVVDFGIEHSLDTGFETELSVIDFATGLDELGHAHAEDVDGFFSAHHFERSLDGVVFGCYEKVR